ncbi:MAG: hypothetical protein FWH21_06925, partial [Kiritimatiellaeota bacterium]|nr:hypothetical protein [Kiritimatiellota bacterium]
DIENDMWLEALLPGEADLTFAFTGTVNALGITHQDTLKVTAVDIAVRKLGTAAAPAGGLVVLHSDVLEFAVAPYYFGAATTMENEITWQYSQLKNDGEYTAWVNFPNNVGKGTTFSTTMDGGIYKVRANIFGNAHEYVWKTDEPTNLGSKKKGDPDHIGVCDTQWQVNVRSQALSHLGSTIYAQGVALPARDGFPAVAAGADKCNIFVAHCAHDADAIVPLINGFRNPSPPTANQWAGVESTRYPRFLFSDVITGWPLFSAGTFPQPGYVAANPVEGGAGHCGIVDYDGLGIAAGQHIVHRRVAHNLLQGITRYRRYEP